MKTFRQITFLLVMLFALLSCKKEDKEVVQEPSKPGFFSLALLNNEFKIDKEILDNNYDFGDIGASIESFFLLTNGGDERIFDIQLSMDHNHFQISPEHINYLEGGIYTSIDENIGIIPILKLGITHGINLDGLGFDYTLPMGPNMSVLTISGKTIDGRDTITISSEFSFSVFARFMDLEIYANSSKINLGWPNVNFLGGIAGLSRINYYYVPKLSDISAKNTGNVPFTMYIMDWLTPTNPVSFEPGDSLYFNTMSSDHLLFMLDGGGTITDQGRIQLGNNAKGYLGLVPWY